MPVVFSVASVDDLGQINDIYNHYISHTAITFDLEPWSMTKRKQWFESLVQTTGYQLFVATDNGHIIGFAYNGQYRPKLAYQQSTEVTVYTAPNNQVKGIGRQLYQLLLNYLNDHGFHRAYALITLPNVASIKLHQHYNFDQVGLMTEVGFKFEQYHDVALLELKL